MTRQRRVLILLACLGALSGCTTYVAHKLPTDGTLKKDMVSGVPYVMTRPEYTVDIASDATDPTKAVYSLKQKDVPDPTQRYTIALSPALFVDGALDLTFGELGNLTSATATTTSRVVATIETAASVASNLALKGITKDMGGVLTTYKTLLESSDAVACTREVKRGGAPIKDALKSRIDLLLDDAIRVSSEISAEKANAKASSVVASRFYYRSRSEKECLDAVYDKARSHTQAQVDREKNKYEAARSTASASAKGKKASEAWIKNLEDAVKRLDVGAIDTLAKSKLDGGVEAASGPAKTYVNTALDAKRLVLMAEQFANMPLDVWRSRRIQDLERALQEKRLEKLVAGNANASIDVEIAQLEGDWAATLGAPGLIQRIAELDRFLAQVRTTSGPAGTGTRFAAAEHVQMREERDKLQEKVDRLRADLVAKNKVVDAEPEKKKVEPRTDIGVKLVKQSFVDAVAANPGKFEDLPEFVLVVSPIVVPPVESLPNQPAGVVANVGEKK